MALNWYPIIDEDKCILCGNCVNFCKNGVYFKENKDKPIVLNPENCILNCQGCGRKCPVGAITYFNEEAIK